MTRAASAAISLRAKENLIRLLFGGTGTYSSTSSHPENYIRNNNKNNNSINNYSPNNHNRDYSYDELKKVYLERIHQLHPDKRHRAAFGAFNNEQQQQHNQQQLQQQQSNVISSNKIINHHAQQKDHYHMDFIELQNAWKRFDEISRTNGFMMMTRNNNDVMKKETSSTTDWGNFTMFGVGCSFADNDNERQLRHEIMNQASKGWFPNGTLPDMNNDQTVSSSRHSNENSNVAESMNITSSGRTSTKAVYDNIAKQQKQQHVNDTSLGMKDSLLTSYYDDDDFTMMSSDENNDNITNNDTTIKTISSKPSLVSHLIPPSSLSRHRKV